METLPIQLALTPVLVAAASLAGRRWGPAVGGYLVGLPLTSGPVSAALAAEHGPAFARAAAIATVQGLTAVAAFVVAYAGSSRRCAWPGATVLALLAFGGAAVALVLLPTSLAVAVATTALALGAARRFLGPPAPPAPRTAAPSWDLGARVATATAMAALLSAAASALGPRWTGLLSPFPVFTCVMAAFAHYAGGPAAAREVLRGVARGLASFGAFFVVVALAVERVSLPATYLLAAAAALLAGLGTARAALFPARRAGAYPRPPPNDEENRMIIGAHSLIYAKDADKARAFFRDVLEFPHVDAGEGWLIFKLPPGEVGVHPGGEGETELYLMCDDVEKTVAKLKAKGVVFTKPIEDQGYGIMTALQIPGGPELGLYQPRHALACSLPGKAAKKGKVTAARKTKSARKVKPARKAVQRSRR